MTTISSIDARFAQTQIGQASMSVQASIKNLVSGTRANANVADLSVGTVLATRVGTLRVTVGNAGQAKSLLETAKGALETILGLLQQQKNLATKSADDSLSNNERGFLDQEFQSIVSEIDRIATNVNFNGKALLDGSISGNAGTSTTTGISNEQYSLLEAKDISTTGTVASGSLHNSHATVGENYITFGAAGADDTVTIYIDADLLDGATAGGTDAVQSIDVAVLSGDSASTVAGKVVAAINAAVSGATDDSYDNFAQFEFSANSSNGRMTIKAKEAGSHLNGYGFSFYDGGASGITATIGTTNTNIENASQAAEQLFTQGAVTTGADGIFKAVAANNIGDTKLSGVLTFGASSAGAGTVNGVKRVQGSSIDTALGIQNGTASTSTLQIVTPGDNGANQTFSFGAVTFTIANANNALTIDGDEFTTAAAQAAAFVGLLNANATTSADYVFSSAGTDTITATRKITGAVAPTLFVIQDETGTVDFTAGAGTTGNAVDEDEISFAGITITAREAGWGDITGNTFSSTGTAIDLDLGVFSDATSQAAEIARILNAQAVLGTGTSENYTYSAAGVIVTATATNFGTPGAEDWALNGNGGGAISASGDVGGSAGVASTATITVTDNKGVAVGQAITFDIAANTGTAAYTANQMAAFFAETMNEDQTSGSRLFDWAYNNGTATVSYTAKYAGTDMNGYRFAIDDGADTFTATANGVSLIGSTVTLSSTAATLGTNKDVAPSDLTFDANLIGGLSNLKGTFSLGAGNDGANDPSNNTVQFTVDVNGVTYTSNVIQLLGSSAASTVSNTIVDGTKILFQRASGPVDANGANTNNGFELTVETDINLASVISTSAGQASLQTVVDNLQTQLDSISINQDRSFALTEINASGSDHRITKAVGTILEGLVGFDAVGTNRLYYADGDIKLISDEYGDAGTHGDVTSFTVDRLTDTISTTINGEVYTAYLNSGNAPTIGGVVAFGTDLDGGTNNGVYSSTTKIITLGSSTGETAKLNFFSANTTDGRVLQIDLGNVAANISQINISTTEGETALADALNAVFGVSSNDSLSFQVGTSATDTIGVSIGSAKTVDIYVDDDNISKTLSVATRSQAIESGEVLDNAINNVISLISDIKAKITAFDSSISNNQASIQNADAARSKLLDTDYTEESTRFAESRVRVQASTSVLAQVNSDIQNLLRLLQ